MTTIRKSELNIRIVSRPDAKDGKKYKVLRMYNLVKPSFLKSTAEKKAHALRKITALHDKFEGCYVPMDNLNRLLGTHIRWGDRKTLKTDRLPGVSSRHLKMTNKTGLPGWAGIRRCLLINKYLVSYIAKMDGNLGMIRAPYIKKQVAPKTVESPLDGPANVTPPTPSNKTEKPEKNLTATLVDIVATKEDVDGLLLSNEERMKGLFKDMEVTKSRVLTLIINLETVNKKIDGIHSKMNGLYIALNANLTPGNSANTPAASSPSDTTNALMRVIQMMTK